MHIWTELAARELAFLVVILAIGAGPACALSSRFDLTSRIALAPVLGFCLGTCVFITTLQFVAADDTYWLVLPLAAGSAAVAGRWLIRSRRRGAELGLGWRDVAQLAAVCLCVAGPLNATLHQRHTVGPAAYSNTDVDAYVGEADGARTASIGKAADEWNVGAPDGLNIADLAQWNWAFVASYESNVDAAPLEANVNALVGLGATETWSSDLIVLLLMGGLAAFAAIRYATRSRTWVAVLVGGLFGGPLFLQLWFDNFQASMIALGLITAGIVVGAESLRTGRRSDLGVLALVFAGLLAVYPYFLAMLLLAGALVLGYLGLVRRRSGRPVVPLVRPLLLRCAGLGLATVVLDPVGLVRAASYFKKILDNRVALPRVSWHLPLDVLPGWLTQTREFWDMPSVAHAGAKQLLLGAVLPAIFIAIMVCGVRRYRPALALVVLGCVCGAVAEYSYASRDACTYCAERNLLPLGPIVAMMIGLGVWALVSRPSSWIRAGGVLAGLLVIVAVGQRTRVELTRFYDASYFLDSADRATLAKLPSGPAGLELEGFGESLAAQAELPLVYYLATEHDPGRVSVPEGADDFGSLFYLTFGQTRLTGSSFQPGYAYVLTRLAGVRTDRQTIRRSGGIALERRTTALDISPYSGLAVPVARLDTPGTAWIQPTTPLRFTIVGPTPGRVWARLTMHGVGLSIPAQPGVLVGADHGDVVVCVPVSGSPPMRLASLTVSAPYVPGAVPAEQWPPPVPQSEAVLDSMQAVSGRCTP